MGTRAQVTPKDAIVKTFLGGGMRETVHPSYQAWSYAELMKSFNSAVYDGHIAIRACAYLHNSGENPKRQQRLIKDNSLEPDAVAFIRSDEVHA